MRRCAGFLGHRCRWGSGASLQPDWPGGEFGSVWGDAQGLTQALTDLVLLLRCRKLMADDGIQPIVPRLLVANTGKHALKGRMRPICVSAALGICKGSGAVVLLPSASLCPAACLDDPEAQSGPRVCAQPTMGVACSFSG